MRDTEMIPMNPLSYKMTTRPVQKKVLGSQDAGNAIPTSMDYVGPNESGVGNVALNVQMMETAEPITNAVHATAMTYLVPFTAFEQFNGSEEEAMRRYEGKESLITGNVEPFFNTNKYWNGTTVVTDTDASTWDTAGGNGRSDFYKTLGLHTQKTTINNSYVQAYNIVQNHRRRARSPQLAERNEFDHTIAEAFWPNSGNSMIVADYDEAVVNGEVNLETLTGKAYVNAEKWTNNTGSYYNRENSATASAGSGSASGGYNTPVSADATNVAGARLFNDIWADLGSAVASFSLAELAQSKLIAEYAKKRASMSGQSEEYIIDLLMRGIMPSSAVSRLPILVGMGKGIFSMNQRYATDAANLEDSVTNGMVNINYRCAVPRTKLGGVLVTQLEVAPEQVWERKKDYFLYTTDAGKLPNALRDHLQIEGGEGVKVVTKDHLDVNHSTPDAILGYAPLNFEHRVNDVRIGGKFYRPASDSTYVEERSRIWSAEAANPSLNTDMYLCTNVHKKVFADQVSDSLEYSVVSDFKLRTDIQFGDRLQETDATSDHAAIEAIADE